MVINLHKALHKMSEIIPVKGRGHFHKNTAVENKAGNKYVSSNKYPEGRVKGDFFSLFIAENGKGESEYIEVNKNIRLNGKV